MGPEIPSDRKVLEMVTASGETVPVTYITVTLPAGMTATGLQQAVRQINPEATPSTFQLFWFEKLPNL